MEAYGEVTKKRFRAREHDRQQMLEVAYYIAGKKKQPIRVYPNKSGAYILTSDLNLHIPGEAYEVKQDGKLFYGTNVGTPAYKIAKRKKAVAKKMVVDVESNHHGVITGYGEVPVLATPAPTFYDILDADEDEVI